jgi:hypothetical protein
MIAPANDTRDDAETKQKEHPTQGYQTGAYLTKSERLRFNAIKESTGWSTRRIIMFAVKELEGDALDE